MKSSKKLDILLAHKLFSGRYQIMTQNTLDANNKRKRAKCTVQSKTLGIKEKIEISCKFPESTRRKSPAEFAAEFEEEVEAKSSMNSKDNREQSVFSDPSEAAQAFE
jgi:hypothetical protein